MRKKEIHLEDLINLWMVPIHGITIEEAYEKEPWENSREFYEKYKITQEEHDKWYDEVIELLSKHFRWSKKRIKKEFTFAYLNCAPTIIKEDEE